MPLAEPTAETLCFERPAGPGDESRVLRAAVAGAAAASITTMLVGALYAPKLAHLDRSELVGWAWSVVVFIIGAGAAHSAATSLGSTPSTRSGWARRLAVGMLAGAFAGCLIGGFGAWKFGSLHLPYMGGPSILCAIVAGALLTAAARLRIADRSVGWGRAVGCAATSLVAGAALLLPVILLVPDVAALDLSAMRALASDYGLGVLGGMLGGLIGVCDGAASVFALWMSASRSERATHELEQRRSG